MGQDEQDDTTVYKVVVNHEEQYSIWPFYRENPLGWQDAGKTSSLTLRWAGTVVSPQRCRCLPAGGGHPRWLR